MIPAAYFQALQAIVIEDPVIDAFTGGTFLVNILILLGIPGDARLETELSFILYVDRAPIAARGAFGGARAFLNMAAFPGTSVFMSILDWIISPGAHFMPSLADRMSFLVESDILRGIFGGFCPAVDVNQRIDIPALQQFISRDVVMGRIEADIFWGKSEGIPSEIVNCVEEILLSWRLESVNFMSNGRSTFRVLFLVQSMYKVCPKYHAFLSLSHPQPASGSE